jgi:hypothetical protein
MNGGAPESMDCPARGRGRIPVRRASGGTGTRIAGTTAALSAAGAGRAGDTAGALLVGGVAVAAAALAVGIAGDVHPEAHADAAAHRSRRAAGAAGLRAGGGAAGGIVRALCSASEMVKCSVVHDAISPAGSRLISCSGDISPEGCRRSFPECRSRHCCMHILVSSVFMNRHGLCLTECSASSSHVSLPCKRTGGGGRRGNR